MRARVEALKARDSKAQGEILGEDNDGLRQPCKERNTGTRDSLECACCVALSGPNAVARTSRVALRFTLGLAVAPFQGSMLWREHPGLRYASPWALLLRPFRALNVNAGTAGPFRVSPPEAMVYFIQLT